MSTFRQKRDQMVKEVRSQLKQARIKKNRVEKSDEQEPQTQQLSIISLIFCLIDKQDNKVEGEEFTDQDFDDFLDILGYQVMKADQEDKILNKDILEALKKRYGEQLSAFVELVLSKDGIDKLEVIKDSNMWDLLRFLFRMEIKKQSHLQVLNALLQSAKLKEQLLLKSELFQQNKQTFMDEIYLLTETKIRLYKELIFMNNITNYRIQQKNKEEQQEKNEEEIKLTHEQQIIMKLKEKWISSQLVLSELFDVKVLQILKNNQNYKVKYSQLIKQFIVKYIQFILINPEIINALLEQLNKNKQLNNQINKDNSPLNKILQIMILQFYSINIKEHEQLQRQIQIDHNQKVQKYAWIDQLNNFIDISKLFIDKIQQLKGRQDKNQGNNQNSEFNVLQHLLHVFIKCYYQVPVQVIFQFIQLINAQSPNELNICRQQTYLLIKSEIKTPIITQIIHSIDSLFYANLVRFIEITSIAISYDDKIVKLLFDIPQFQGDYNRYTFESILQNNLLNHISIQIRIKSLWLLTNITGSQLYYQYGFNFIADFFNNDILQQDYFYDNPSNQINLIWSQIIQVIMNYLCNMNQKETKNLFDIKKQNNGKEKEAQNRYRNQIENQMNNNVQNRPHIYQQINNKPQSILQWIIRLLFQLINKFVLKKSLDQQEQRLVQVFIYSICNLIHLSEKIPYKQNLVLFLLQSSGIFNCLQLFYNKSSTESSYFGMLKQFLDEIIKAKVTIIEDKN